MVQEPVRALAERAVARLVARGETVAAAESLTGGLVADAFVVVPGASAAFRGGVVAYATDLKHALLGVPADLLAERGPVDGDVAVEMARGARERLGADWGISTTGVAGPEPQDGVPVGRVFVGVSGPAGDRSVRLDLPGSRPDVRRGATGQVLTLLLAALDGTPGGTARGTEPGG